jgi:hypothetical protein
MKETILFC